MRGRTVPLILVCFYYAEVLVFIFLPNFGNLVLAVRLQFWVPVETSVETPPRGNTFHLSLLVIISPPFWMKKLLIPSVPFRFFLSTPPTCEVRPPLACSSSLSLWLKAETVWELYPLGNQNCGSFLSRTLLKENFNNTGVTLPWYLELCVSVSVWEVFDWSGLWWQGRMAAPSLLLYIDR